MDPSWQRWLGVAALSLFLAGCDPSQSAAPEKPLPPQATAPALPAAMPVVPQAPIEQPSKRQMRELIAQVEEAYKRGEANYRRGRLVESKVEFDRAVDLMLASGIDIRNEPQLEAEFNKIIDGVNALEMEALKVGNGFVQPEEPAPAAVAAEEVTFNVDPSILAKAQKDLATTKSDLPLVVNDYVAGFINFFANTKKGHNTLLHSFQRSGRYKAMIERVMAEEGMPQDLIYLAVAESGFNPRAIGPMTRSGGRAGGMWQFMPSSSYGLVRNAYVDERFDPEKSTRAYARYMKFIYAQLGDWYLAMAGYNWGSGNVQRAVQKTGYADFWELYKRNNLPGETKNYVPEILAAIIIANHPEQYGFEEILLDPPVLIDTVTVNYSVHLRLVSDLVGAPMDEMLALNPSLLRGVTPPDAAFDLHLPPGTTELFNKRIAAIPESHRNAWRFHKLAAGETLATVARDFHVSVDTLADANEIENDARLEGMDGLVVPAAAVAAPAAAARAQMYTARKGDTLVTIADRFGVSLTQLRAWNKMTGIKVLPGRKLRISDASNQPGTSRPRRSSASTNSPSTNSTPSSNAKAKTGTAAKSAAPAKKAAPPAAKHNSGAAKSTSAPRPTAPQKTKSRATAGQNKTSSSGSTAHTKTQTPKQK